MPAWIGLAQPWLPMCCTAIRKASQELNSLWQGGKHSPLKKRSAVMCVVSNDEQRSQKEAAANFPNHMRTF
jgi:hypothetical protein